MHLPEEGVANCTQTTMFLFTLTREEIRSIEAQELRYRKMKYHSDSDVMSHANRQLRLAAISAELQKLLPRSA
jgi:hypothetical protein